MLLGCIGDDFTGSSDIANTLAKGGMKVTQYTGIPTGPAASDVEAGVVSLKSRTIAVDEAISQSLDAAKWLLDQGCEQIFFKYCSTFDSTPEGNIGPVAEALAEYLKEDQVLFCPAFPATGRSIYQGYLFVNDTLLSESGMKDHPLTPMTDSDLRRWLQHQTKWGVKHIAHSVVKKGAETIKDHMKASAPAFYIADAIDDEDLIILGNAAIDRKLLTGGSGLALGLPQNFRDAGKINESNSDWQKADGKAIILSGSCSIATRGQVAKFKQTNPSMEITAEDVFSDKVTTGTVCDWIEQQENTPLVYSSADPEVVKAAQEKFGTDIIAEKIEGLMSSVAGEMANRGAMCIISAGGETSGAVVKGLEVAAMEIGPEIAPGVPALKDVDRGLVLALKSGNFGGEDFFQDALAILSNA
jgi:uncharacterized protein YgbK (DUF1537 family)